MLWEWNWCFSCAANYKAVRCLALNSLNPERCSIILQHFMKTGQGMWLNVPCHSLKASSSSILFPEFVVTLGSSKTLFILLKLPHSKSLKGSSIKLIQQYDSVQHIFVYKTLGSCLRTLLLNCFHNLRFMSEVYLYFMLLCNPSSIHDTLLRQGFCLFTI